LHIKTYGITPFGLFRVLNMLRTIDLGSKIQFMVTGLKDFSLAVLWAAVYCLPCTVFAQSSGLPFEDRLSGRQFDVINIETNTYHRARRDDGVLRVHDGGIHFNGWAPSVFQNIPNETSSPYRTFSQVNHLAFAENSFFQTAAGFFRTERVIRTSTGELFIQAQELFDQNDGQSFYHSVRGQFLHSQLIPIGDVIARQVRQGCQVGMTLVRADSQESATAWAQALQSNPSQTLEEDRQRRTTRQGRDEVRYMTQVACLTNGHSILRLEHNRQYRAPVGGNFNYQAEVFEVIATNGRPATSSEFAQAWFRAPDILNPERSPTLWAQLSEDNMEGSRQ
jgi:hypothetical protein